MQIDRRTDIKKLTVAFRNFESVSKKSKGNGTLVSYIFFESNLVFSIFGVVKTS